MSRHATFQVTVKGYDPIVYAAETAAKARLKAFHQYADAYHITLGRFLAISKVRRVPAPAGVEPTQLERGWCPTSPRNHAFHSQKREIWK